LAGASSSGMVAVAAKQKGVTFHAVWLGKWTTEQKQPFYRVESCRSFHSLLLASSFSLFFFTSLLKPIFDLTEFYLLLYKVV
jgi:hypothetical protein